MSNTPLAKLYAHARKFITRNRLEVSTTTGFFRNDRQMETIIRLLPRPRTVYFFGCSDGCEPYTFAMLLKLADPAAPLPRIFGWDINEGCIEKARSAVYEANLLDYYRTGEPLSSDRAALFQRTGENAYRVDDTIARSCAFELGSVIDDDFMGKLAPSDLVFCQNVLVHLNAEQNHAAVRYLSRLLTPQSLLAIGGMRPELRSEVTREANLQPVTDDCREIHDGWRDLRGMWDRTRPWARDYFCLEPFRETSDWPFRYGSLFRRK